MERLLLTLATLAVAGLVYLLMLRGWHRRARRQADVPAPPPAPAVTLALVPAVRGLFVGTTSASDWLDRIAVHGLSRRSKAELVVCREGVHLVRDDGDELFLPVMDLTDVAVEDSLAGKVIAGGMLVLTWRLGDRVLATAFRADDRTTHIPLRDAIAALIQLEAA